MGREITLSHSGQRPARVPDLPTEAIDAAPNGTAEAGSRHRILIVEDEYFIAAEMEDMLRAADIDVVGPVGTVSEALRLVEAADANGGITAAVLDVSLLGERVTPVADALAARGIPFVYATGYSRREITTPLPTAPVLEKPVDYGALFRSLRELSAVRPLAGEMGTRA